MTVYFAARVNELSPFYRPYHDDVTETRSRAAGRTHTRSKHFSVFHNFKSIVVNIMGKRNVDVN